MRVFILFSTTEGHARKLARFAAARLARLGHEACVCDAARSDQPGLVGCDSALLIASVHVGHYRRSFVAFARKHHDALNAMPTAFVSVSLSAAGDNPSDLAGLHRCVERLKRDTAWRPGAVHHAAGAMAFSAYGFFTKLAIKLIARKRGKAVNTSEDYDLTDYAALETFIDAFAANAVSSGREGSATTGYDCARSSTAPDWRSARD
jgi:menaquinone-dependent protoporphyrinogen oxidase